MPDGSQSTILFLVFNTKLAFYILISSYHNGLIMIQTRDSEYSLTIPDSCRPVYIGSQSTCWKQNRVFWAITFQSKILSLAWNVFSIIILPGFKKSNGDWEANFYGESETFTNVRWLSQKFCQLGHTLLHNNSIIITILHLVLCSS